MDGGVARDDASQLPARFTFPKLVLSERRLELGPGLGGKLVFIAVRLALRAKLLADHRFPLGRRRPFEPDKRPRIRERHPA
jgi:hypothetical protein